MSNLPEAADVGAYIAFSEAPGTPLTLAAQRSQGLAAMVRQKSLVWVGEAGADEASCLRVVGGSHFRTIHG